MHLSYEDKTPDCSVTFTVIWLQVKLLNYLNYLSRSVHLSMYFMHVPRFSIYKMQLHFLK